MRAMKEIRNTFQKTAVYETLQTMHDHPTADKVFEEVRKQHPNISRSTVYRILNQLSDRGMIYKVAMPSVADRYDFHAQPHYHVHCIQCGAVGDIDMDWQSDLQEKAQQRSEYYLTSHNIVFEGVCPTCQKKVMHNPFNQA